MADKKKQKKRIKLNYTLIARTAALVALVIGSIAALMGLVTTLVTLAFTISVWVGVFVIGVLVAAAGLGAIQFLKD